jgi:hypothetical protein
MDQMRQLCAETETQALPMSQAVELPYRLMPVYVDPQNDTQLNSDPFFHTDEY